MELQEFLLKCGNFTLILVGILNVEIIPFFSHSNITSSFSRNHKKRLKILISVIFKISYNIFLKNIATSLSIKQIIFLGKPVTKSKKTTNGLVRS